MGVARPYGREEANSYQFGTQCSVSLVHLGSFSYSGVGVIYLRYVMIHVIYSGHTPFLHFICA